MENTLKALNFDEIYLLIKPFSELGRKAKRDFKLFESGSEAEARDYYRKLNTLLILVNKFPEQISYLGSILSHFEDIGVFFDQKSDNVTQASSFCIGNSSPPYPPHECGGRTFEMHEIHEIKHFVYFYQRLCKQTKSYFDHIIPRRNFEDLYALLDIDGQDSPTFYLSNQYSERFKELKDELTMWQSKSYKKLNEHTTKIISELNITKFEETITISRLNQTLLKKLVESQYFYISDENFANITLKIKKPDELYEIENKIYQINQELEIEAQNIKDMLSAKVWECKDELLKALEEVGIFDLLLAKVVFARTYQCVIPEIMKKNKLIDVKNIFNIFLQAELHKVNIKFQKINIKIHNKVNIITGSNMGGKTTILKTIGQIALMAKYGMPVPAEKAEITLFDNVFFSGPTTNEDRSDLSSFGFEIITMQNIIETKGFNLFLLDEFGRGTNPTEGQALFHSVIQYFSMNTETVLVSTTHYNPPQKLQNFSHFQMIGLQIDFVKDLKTNKNLNLIEKLKLINKYMNYQPIEVEAYKDIPNSALWVAEILGLEKEIVEMGK